MDIVIHLTGAIDWTGWILAAVLAPIAAVSFYGFLKMFRWMERYKLMRYCSGAPRKGRTPKFGSRLTGRSYPLPERQINLI